MKQKFDYPVVGKIEVSALNLAFINKMFGIVTTLGKRPYLMGDDMELIMDVAMMTALGQHCGQFIEDLHDIHALNGDACKQAQTDVAPDAAHATLGMMMASITTRNDPEARSAFDKMVEEAFSQDNVKEAMKAHKESIKSRGAPNAPETGYQ